MTVMLIEDTDLVTLALRDLGRIRDWTPRQFELLFRQASSSHLLHRIGAMIDAAALTSAIPEGLANHLEGARRLVLAHQEEVRREVRFIQAALEPLQVPVVLLKGAAYLQAELPSALGRLFSDIDILVPRPRLAAVEERLMLNGWVGTHEDAYDQRYYREWMHELPPMVHSLRQTALDVHHAITPLTGRWRPPVEPLLRDAVPVPGHVGLYVLAPVDMVLHSMVHLLLNDDLSHGLRDLSDLDLLLRGFAVQAGFWDALLARASELELQRALHHGLWAVAEILHTPIPHAVQAVVASWGVGPLATALLHGAWRLTLRTPHPSVDTFLSPAALFLLYLRAHWLRMPPAMLVRHLATKATMRRQAKKAVVPA